MTAPLHYEIRKPNQMDPNRLYPALFLLHGMGSNEKDLLPLVQGLEEQYLIFSIRGPIPQPPGYAFFTIEGFGKPHVPVFENAMDLLTQFLDYANATYPVHPHQTYFMGFSQGAISSMSLSTRIPDRIRGVIALSGYVPAFVKQQSPLPDSSKVSYFISHGQQDPVLPFQWGVQASDYFSSLGANVAFTGYPDGHFISQQVVTDFRNWLQQQS